MDKDMVLINFVNKVNKQMEIKIEEIKEKIEKTSVKNTDWFIDNAQLIGMERAQSIIMDVFIKEIS